MMMLVPSSGGMGRVLTDGGMISVLFNLVKNLKSRINVAGTIQFSICFTFCCTFLSLHFRGLWVISFPQLWAEWEAVSGVWRSWTLISYNSHLRTYELHKIEGSRVLRTIISWECSNVASKSGFCRKEAELLRQVRANRPCIVELLYN